ncbi:DUF4979 domain-containing protein [Pelobium manganitolerans]|uniref:DUF4979 domain-containing protein n=1 Tax=Pelobium manganitolerans TaxID=1842495 RepID=UPI003FA39729
MNIFTKLSLTTALMTSTVIGAYAQIGPQIDVDFVATKSYTGWMTPTSGASLSQDAVTGVLTLSPTTTSKYRGDFRYTGGTVSIDAINYPIIAVKFNKPSTGNITFDTSNGDYRKPGSGTQNNQQTLLPGSDNVYYYDLTSGSGAQLGASNLIDETRFPGGTITCTSFQFKIADMTVRENYDFYWIKSFASVADLTAYVAKTVTGVKALGWDGHVDLNWKPVTNATSYTIRRFTADNPLTKTEVATGITGTSYSNTGLTNGTTYYYEVTAVVESAEGGFESAVAAKPVANTAFASWNHQDIGTAGLTGNAGFSTDGTFTINAAGKDVWNNDEGFHYAYQTLDADGYIVAKVNGLVNTHASAKAGVMIREGLGNTSREILATLNPAFTAELGYTKTGGSIKYDLPVTDGASGNYRWVKLSRSGAVITASYSVDGTIWVEGPSVTFDAESPMKNADVPVYVGVFAVSHDVNKLTTATFSDITVVEGTLPVSLTNYDAKLNSNGQVNLNWTVSSENNNNYFLVERKSEDGAFSQLAKISSKGNGAAVYAYTDANAVAGINYYRLSQVDLNGKQTELGIRSVNVSLTGQVLSVFPNPITNNQFSFTYKQAGNTAFVKIVDLAGKTVFSQTVKGNDGLFNVSTPAGIKAGIYILEVDQAIKQKVVFK